MAKTKAEKDKKVKGATKKGPATTIVDPGDVIKEPGDREYVRSKT